MINKQNLWFLTLFSLILVLSIYYITMPNDLLLSKEETRTIEENNSKNDNTVVSITESETIEALRVNLEEEREEKKKDLQTLLTDGKTSTEEKNNAYNELQQIAELTSKEASIEKKLKDKFNYSVFVKIDNNEITVVVDSKTHDVTLANKIMRSIQEEFKEKVYITVQFK